MYLFWALFRADFGQFFFAFLSKIVSNLRGNLMGYKIQKYIYLFPRDIMSIYKEPPPGMFVVPDPHDMTKVSGIQVVCSPTKRFF